MDISLLRKNYPDHWTLATAIRVLTLDAVAKAKSGHSGMPMGMADVATVLFKNHMRFDPAVPNWSDRDRFILSKGHGCLSYYAALSEIGYIKNDDLKKTIEDMKVHEIEHCQFFENEIKKRNIKPTKFLPLWDLLGVGLGFGSTLLGKKAAMLCTASVEEVIDKHYLNQINQLGPNEKDLKKKIIKFREDELHHKDIAYDNGATKKGLFGLLDKVIKTSSRIAITISEKI